MGLRAGLIGFGLAGRFLHAPLIEASGIAITGIVTSRAADVQSDYPSASVSSSAEELCAASNIDVIVVATPDHRHVANARTALAAGKHVVIDKPFAPTSYEALALIAEARQRKLLLTVFHNRRWDNDFLTAQKLIREGTLGEIVHYAARWDRYRPDVSIGWRQEHMLGELYGLGSHLVDQALVLFGAPDWLVADVYKQRSAPGQNDGFEILMGKGRLRITLGVNFHAADELRGVRVLGTHAAFSKSGMDPQETQLRARHAISDHDFGVEDSRARGRLVTAAPRSERRVGSERGDWLAFYRGVRAAIETGAPAPVDARDAARCIAILEAVMEASRTGQRLDVANWLATRALT